MKTIIIDATGRSAEESKTKYLATGLMSKLNIEDLQVADLYNMDIPFLTNEIIADWKTERKDTQAMRILTQFEEADQYIFIYPTWNWSVPAILHAYLDLVIVSGRTFGYDKNGKSEGYLRDKKAVLISTTGGKSYSRVKASILKAQDGNNYMQQILNTLGVKDIETYSIDNTAYNFNDKDGNFSKELYSEKVEELIKRIS